MHLAWFCPALRAGQNRFRAGQNRVRAGQGNNREIGRPGDYALGHFFPARGDFFRSHPSVWPVSWESEGAGARQPEAKHLGNARSGPPVRCSGPPVRRSGPPARAPGPGWGSAHSGFCLFRERAPRPRPGRWGEHEISRKVRKSAFSPENVKLAEIHPKSLNPRENAII